MAESHPDYATYSMGDFNAARIARNLYKIVYGSSDGGIVQTGADVNVSLSIPFAHRWLRTHFYHCTSAYVASVDFLTIYIRRMAATPANFADYLYYRNRIQCSKLVRKWGIGFEFEAQNYNLVTNTTNTDKVIPLFYVEKLEE